MLKRCACLIHAMPYHAVPMHVPAFPVPECNIHARCSAIGTLSAGTPFLVLLRVYAAQHFFHALLCVISKQGLSLFCPWDFTSSSANV